MAELVVSSKELRQKKEQLSQLAGTLKSQVTSYEQLGKSLNSMWDGDAKDTFVKKLDLDLEKILSLLKLVMEFITLLDKIIALYAMMEAKNVATANG